MDDLKMASIYIFCLTLSLGLFSCSNEIILKPSIKPQNKPISNRSNEPSVESKIESPVNVVGEFTNIESDGEHEWGYSVQIWRQGDKIYGLISGQSTSRLIGDSPTGLLEKVNYDSKSGKLSFTAKLTLGLFAGEHSRDVYEFNGMLTKKKLVGDLLATNELCPDKCPENHKLSLPRSKELSSEMEEFNTYKSYAEWKEYADKILSFRGPDW